MFKPTLVPAPKVRFMLNSYCAFGVTFGEGVHVVAALANEAKTEMT